MGVFLTQIGCAGEGPGEYRDASALALGAGDTLYVLDRIQRRLTVLDPAYRLVRAIRLSSSGFDLVVLPRVIVLNSHDQSPSRVGLPFHRYDHAGRELPAFGSASVVILPEGIPLLRRLAESRRGGVWAAPLWGRYTIEHYTQSGELTERFARSPSWFPKLDRIPAMSSTAPPPSAVNSLAEDNGGLLWVTLSVTDPRWKEAVIFGATPSERGACA